MTGQFPRVPAPPRPPVPAAPDGWIVAIPAKNEAMRLPACLVALDEAAARSALPVRVLVFANDCEDETATVAERVAAACGRLEVRVEEACLPTDQAHAGGARRRCVDLARAVPGAANPLLLTTDADARLDTNAFARMESAFSRGASVVLAKLECVPDPFDPVPQAALDWGTPAVLWRHAVRQLAETMRLGVQPDPPCHDDYGGAGIATTLDAYEALGGFPAVTCEEDLAFVRAADAAGLNVDRRSGASVHVLARARGRAVGGMATALAENAVHAAANRPRLVERHELTVSRLLADPSPANAFDDEPAALEPVHEALLGLQTVTARYPRAR